MGERDAGTRELGRDAERLRPEPGEDDARMVTATCIYPGCERPAVPAHAAGGPPSAFCDLEEHNALTAHQERKRRESGDRPGVSRGVPARAPDGQDGAEPHDRG